MSKKNSGEDNCSIGVVRRFMQLGRSRGFPHALMKAVYYLLHRFLFLYVEYARFLFKAPHQLHLRLEILKSFRKIHKGVACSHREGELLRIADEILLIPHSLEGDIIELGVYKGGASCKLSFLAKIVKRRLIICDAFEGLPAPREDERRFFQQGTYVGRLDEVRNNILHFGAPDCVEIIPGWFQDTLPKLRDRKLITVFEDVDLYESVRCCLENLWLTLQPGCKMFTHEIPYPPALKAYTDETFWREKFGCLPPSVVRVGVGLRIGTYNLGYIQKPANKSGLR